MITSMTLRRDITIEWVVLDLGETLIDETREWGRWADYLEVPRLTFFALIGAVIAQRRPHTDAFEILRPGFDLREEIARKTAMGLGWTATTEDLYPDTIPTLIQLRAAGYKIAVMANQPSSVEAFMATLPIDLYATSASWGISKPDSAFFARVAQEIGASPAAIVYVGDRIDNDIIPAKAAMMRAVHLRRGPWGVIQAEWPEATRADAGIGSLSDLPAALHSF